MPHQPVNPDTTKQASFSDWLRQPQTLIGLSAVLLSLCGLFISIYEASLTRRSQRASVWPHIEVGASLNPGAVKLWVENTGLGPARIQAATVTYDGDLLTDWAELVRRLDASRRGVSGYQSMISGSVLPAGAPETIFAVTADSGATARAFTDRLAQELRQGTVDVTVCYCSVYEECWTSSLQALMNRTRDTQIPARSGRVDNCAVAQQSGI